jgi:calcineurin-like phosphoesterase family protein
MDFIISDPHFNHGKIINYEQRPFDNAKHMNETIVTNWNNEVTDRDRVFVLGDVMFSRNSSEILEMLNKLNGKIIIILGNHDKPLTDLAKHGKVVFNQGKIRIIRERILDTKVCITEGMPYEKVVMSHYPIFSWNGKYHGRKHFYGHVHTGDEWKDFMKLNFKNAYNVSVELLGYTPRTFRDAIEINDMVRKNE